jgi:FkbM family methyltransferase
VVARKDVLEDRAEGSGGDSAMKHLAKRWLSELAAHLPGGGRAAILERLCAELEPSERLDLIARLAKGTSVVGLDIAGRYGTIQGEVHDGSVLRSYAQHGTWAERTNHVLRTFFADRGGGYIDVGANIGLTTIPVASDASVRCLALEPEPATFSHLRSNVAVNCRHGNVELHRVAAFSHRDTLCFEISSRDLGDHRLRLGEAKPGRYDEDRRATIRVDAVPLDEVARGVPEPLAVKIDTQGAEPFVVAGGRATLSRARMVVLEFSPYLLARLGGDVDAMLHALGTRFAELRIADGEEGAISDPQSSAELCSRLAALATTCRDKPEVYFDVIGIEA